MNKIFSLTLLTFAFFFIGCASIPQADKKLDTEAKLFKAHPEKSILYVYRNEAIGGAVRMDVMVDNELLGETRTGHYLWINMQPGVHVISSRAENSHDIELKTEPGKVYYVWQEAKMGIMYARTKLNVVDEKTGQTGVRECSLVQHRQPRGNVNARLH
ncbi:DUF2846 domain-containing protein [Bdellovibrio sp. BCCA]|uniref:DUF2846 domain-containing protein n=1 Tax=Bdellovibrio sp. BCCA TaxID=3136281 RepID=UPI0030F10AFE